MGQDGAAQEPKRIGFELKSRNLPLEEFPWKDLLPDRVSDPCTDADIKCASLAKEWQFVRDVFLSNC